MSNRRHGARGFRPSPEGLEGRTLLSKVVSGVDSDGDAWTLRVYGPGDLRVTNQLGTDNKPIPLGQRADISMIEVGGALPSVTRLVGTVKKAPGSNGKVFFQDLEVIGTRGDAPSTIYGIHAIDMPDFWLGHTERAAPTSSAAAATINSPEGVNTLRFGGVDVTYLTPGGTAATTSTNYTVNLGLPRTQGTSIIVDQVISNGTPAATPTAQAIQNSVTFTVDGRLNLFQANQVIGNAAVPSNGFPGGGGTLVRAESDLQATATGTGIQGPIGIVRVGGNATNFGVLSNDRVSNVYVGGETNNVNLTAFVSLRNVYFGLGMDTTTIRTGDLFTLRANRGALNSTVRSDARIGQILIGGDVVNTNVTTGIKQDLPQNTQFGAPSNTPSPIQEGKIHQVLVAGNIKNSVFAASTVPQDGVYNASTNLYLPRGMITAKVEGEIDNSTATPLSPNQAFYAETVHVAKGPVTPPNVVEPPFPGGGKPPTGPRLAKFLQPTDPVLRAKIANTWS